MGVVKTLTTSLKLIILKHQSIFYPFLKISLAPLYPADLDFEKKREGGGRKNPAKWDKKKRNTASIAYRGRSKIVCPTKVSTLSPFFLLFNFILAPLHPADLDFEKKKEKKGERKNPANWNLKKNVASIAYRGRSKTVFLTKVSSLPPSLHFLSFKKKFLAPLYPADLPGL